MPEQIEVQGLRELQARFAQFPGRFDAGAGRTMQASLLALQESVPPYPPPPATSRYRRTGQLGRSLGASQSGQPIGAPDIMRAQKIGGGWEGDFGSNLSYAPDVVGEQQKMPWAGYWWNVKTIVQVATAKIERLWQIFADELAAFLDGR